MGLFDAFKKKNCDICGGEIGLLGNRKLEDGNMCKNCAKKLSPWFDERRHSTIAQIEEQLAYREANKAKVAAFHTTRVLGNNTKVMLDEDAGLFMITSARDLEEANPDVLAFSDVTGCELDISESQREIKRKNPDGTEESYRPPRYNYYYDFYVIVRVQHPYFDDMRFKLNSSSVEIETTGFGGRGRGRGNVEYQEYENLGQEIKEALMDARRQGREVAAAAAAPKTAVTCPWCGATTMPDANGCCEYCGGAING